MPITHVYQTPDGDLLRRHGDDTVILPCKRIVTRVTMEPRDNSRYAVTPDLFGLASPTLLLDRWFLDWKRSHNLSAPSSGEVVGKLITMLVPSTDFKLLMLPEAVPGHEIASRERVPYQGMQAVQPRGDEPYYGPVAAIFIDGRWVEPIGFV